MVIPEGLEPPYLQIRNLSLYPDELRDHGVFMTHFTADFQTSYGRPDLSSAHSHRGAVAQGRPRPPCLGRITEEHAGRGFIRRPAGQSSRP